MKVSLFFFLLMLFTLNSLAQNNFEWVKTDSIQKTKEQIYSATKMFIAETWKSSKEVIQNDDKDGGIILIKGKTEINWEQPEKVGMTKMTIFHDSWYSYNVTFRMKNSKYQIKIDNVTPDDDFQNSTGGSFKGLSPEIRDWTFTPEDSVASINSMNKYGIKMNKKMLDAAIKGEKEEYPLCQNVINSLHSNLQNIVSDYSDYLKRSVVSTDF
jgi:hypothetical protein